MQNGLAYHFLIGNGIDSGDGEVEIGPRWKRQLLGGHVKNYKINLNSNWHLLGWQLREDSPEQKANRSLHPVNGLATWRSSPERDSVCGPP